jgi:LAO/AO transport system kinase
MGTTPPADNDSGKIDGFVESIIAGNVRAGARAMRLVDDQQPIAIEILRRLYPQTGGARIIGVTGNPGSGKSTLTDKLIAEYRSQGLKVGVVAVDPSSPFTGGAILGDRIRMAQHATDPEVFIRSVATRGHLGGLSSSTNDIVSILDAMGHDVILLETVGVGQDEVEVVRVAHTAVVVLVPGLGDDIQAIKAGILEIADIFVVNKADRDGVERTIKDLRNMQQLTETPVDWQVPIVRTVAPRGQGVPELIDAITKHGALAKDDVSVRQRLRTREEYILESLIVDRLSSAMSSAMGDKHTREELLDALLERRTDPYTEADRIVAILVSEQN